MATRQEGGTVQATETSFRIIERLQEMDGARVSEVANSLDMAKSTAHRHLKTLQECGYVVKEGDEYTLSLLFDYLARYAKSRKPSFRIAEKKVDELAEQTGERVQFMVEENGYARYLHRACGSRGVRLEPSLNERTIPLHSIGAGKAILAFLPEEEVDRIVEKHGLTAENSLTITDREELDRELERIRERGYSINRGENIAGLKSIGVPVKAPDDRVIGALSVSGPEHRFKGEWFEEELPDILLGAANELELNIKYARS